MSDILSAIASDIAEYEALCKRYGEKVHYEELKYGKIVDCYGEHAEHLKKRHKEELEFNE